MKYMRLKCYTKRGYITFLKGVGTKERVIIQILCPKEAREIEKLKDAYKRGILNCWKIIILM